jgi:UDP-3-O-[3-hydroxymyristoyl] glucosamine N-acyltransferase
VFWAALDPIRGELYDRSEKKMKISDIAALVSGQWEGDGSLEITGIAGLERAGAADITFVDSGRALVHARRSDAGCFLIPPNTALPRKNTIAVIHPKLALIKLAPVLLPAPCMEAGVHSTAIVAADARLATDVSVGAHAVIEAGASIGNRTRIAAGACIGRGVEIGADCVIYPRVSIYPDVHIGDRVVIHSGAVIGADGFGYVFAEGRHQKFPQLGGVIIEDDVEIGSNTTIDRGSLGETSIGAGTKIDNLVQIAHNVRIGRHCIITAQVGIAGSARIGDGVMLGGQVGIADRARIEDQASIGAQAGVLPGKVVRRGSALWGTPARPMAEYKETYAHILNLPRLERRVEELAARINRASGE